MSSVDLRIEPITPAIGAEITGIDLTSPLASAACEAIYAALLEHHVIFFRDQPLSPASHLALAQSFGDLDGPHPVYPHVDDFENIMKLENGPDNPPDTDGWHTDLTFKQDPPFASILWAKKIPPVGGDTLWASLSAAYRALPEDMKSLLSGLNAVHDMGDFRNNFSVGETSGEKLTAAHQKFGSAIHPIIRNHPATGRPYIYVNEGFTQQIVGMRATDSNRLLSWLFRHIEQPEFQVRFRWSENALAMWDNRCTLHYATGDYLPHRRCMHRITVLNDRRAGAESRAA